MAIEFSRNITFGQYLDLGSPVHRLDPRAKILATGALMLALLLARGFAGFAVAFAAAIALQLVSRVPLGYILRGMRLLALTMAFIFVFQVVFYPSPPDPWWQWGVLSLSAAGLSLALQTLLRVMLIYYFTSMLMFTTGLMDLADGMESLLEPLKRLRAPVNELVMTFVIALKFVPLLVAELERMFKARAARGDRLDQGSFLERVRKVGSILVPLFVNALARAEVVTMAMNARCYRGGQGRTKRRVLRMARPDWLALLLGAAVAVAIVAAGRLPVL
jgi:energy-coupling factor transport system permease protein